MSDHIPTLGGGEVFEEVTVAARQALSMARRRSPHTQRSYSRGRGRGQQFARYTIARTRRVRSDTDRTANHPDTQRALAERLDTGDLSRAAMLARWATAVAAAEAAHQIVAELADTDPALEDATLDAAQAQIHANAWEERLRTEEGIDVSGLAAQPAADLEADLDTAEPGTSPRVEATTAATAELADADLEPVPVDAHVGDLLEQTGLGLEPLTSQSEASSSSFAADTDYASGVDLDAGHGIDD